MTKEKITSIQTITATVTKELANKETMQALVATTFKGLEADNVKQAMIEGMMRGYTFQDFLEKNVYAIPFVENKGRPNEKQTYSLVSSIDHARKIGMKSGVVGVSEPVYEMNGQKLVACSITIKRRVGNDIGDFSAKVYFDEYTTGQNQWTKKPRTMLAKVAEMHALRKACPEALSQVYTSDEMGDKIIETTATTVSPKAAPKLESVDVEIYGKKLAACKTVEELKTVFSAIPMEAKNNLVELKDKMKVKLTPKK
jgi:hypothetical protein